MTIGEKTVVLRCTEYTVVVDGIEVVSVDVGLQILQHCFNFSSLQGVQLTLQLS